MKKHELPLIRHHEDVEYFREMVKFTAAETRFSARLIEKDYFSSVLLEHMVLNLEDLLVFKGGTCLAKVHAAFYRLSEDLDFMISLSSKSKRTERRRRMDPVRQMMNELPDRLPFFREVASLTGANESTQYIGVLGYRSLFMNQEETIKIEIGLREPLQTPAVKQKVQTILLDPLLNRPIVEPVTMTCISKIEAYAEKFRAALTRREAAIRDFFDIDYASRRLGLDSRDKQLERLIQSKIEVPGNEPIDVSEKRRSLLQQQKATHLKPVLREDDYQAFDLDRAFRIVRETATRLAQKDDH
jgi:predicted nucleotidyltransferase component of viral defense system